MFKAHRYLGAYVVAAGLMAAAPACASSGYSTYQRDYRDVERRVYQNGFDVGVRQGERDARDRRSYAHDRDRDYRNADRGYSRGWGDRDDYRRVFRRGYEAGYTEGFNRIARSYAPVYPSYPGVVGSRDA